MLGKGGEGQGRGDGEAGPAVGFWGREALGTGTFQGQWGLVGPAKGAAGGGVNPALRTTDHGEAILSISSSDCGLI